MTETAAGAEPLLLRLQRTERFKHREIIGGLLVMHAYRAGHGGTLYALWNQLERQLPDEMTCASQILVPFEMEMHEYCPDLMVIPKARVAGDIEICKPQCIAIVFEVISPETQDFDYGIKAETYARAEVAEYVIFDPYTHLATRFAQPKGGEYRLRQIVRYGEPVEVELPYPIVIETADPPVDPKS